MLLVFVVKDLFFNPLVINVKSVEISNPKLSLASYGLQTDSIIFEKTKVAVVSLEIHNPSLLKRYSLVDIKVHEKGDSEIILGNIIDMGNESGLLGVVKPLETRNCSNVTILLLNKDEKFLLEELAKTKFVATGIVFGNRQTISKPFKLSLN